MLSLRLLLRTLATFTLVLTLTSSFSAAQPLPDRPIFITSPYAGGGPSDFSIRTIARKVEEMTGRTIIIENKTGGGGIVAAQAVKSSTPDGTRLLLADAGTFGANVTVFPNLPYDPIVDFKPVTLLWTIYSAIVIKADSPINTVADFVKHARSEKSGLTYASPATGSIIHLQGSTLAKTIGVTMHHVAYRGAVAGASDVAAGRIDFCFCSHSTIRGLVEGHKLKMIGLAAPTRDSLLPDLPTLAESGISVPENIWFGIVAPANTPDDIVMALNEMFVKAATSPDVIEKFRLRAERITTNTPTAFRSLISSDIERYRPIVLEAGVQVK